MPLPHQQLAFVSVQLRLEPALSCPLDDLQGLAQQKGCFFKFARDLTCHRQAGDVMGRPQLRPSGAVSAQTTAQERYALHQITTLGLAPSEIDGSLCTPPREALLRSNRNQLLRALI